MEFSETCKRAHLVSNLDGSAKAWLLGQGTTWSDWNYTQLKEQMIGYFAEENRMHARKLQGLK